MAQAADQGAGSPTDIWLVGGFGGVLVNDVPTNLVENSDFGFGDAMIPGIDGMPNVGTNANSFSVTTSDMSEGTTVDVSIEESPDGGNTWVRIYDLSRITEDGTYYTPVLPITWGTAFHYGGIAIKGGGDPYVNIGGNRIMHSGQVPFMRSFIDRSIDMETLDSVTPTYFVDRANTFSATLTLGDWTTPPVLTLEGSEDALNWYTLNGTFAGVANRTTNLNLTDVLPKFARVRVSTAGVSETGDDHFVTLKAIEN